MKKDLAHIKEKLITYGFVDWQIDILLSKKVLDTSHGVYKLKGDELYLTKHHDKSTEKVM